MSNDILAWTYSLHHQIVNAMIINNGKNNFYMKRVVTFLCRSHFIVAEDGGRFHCILVGNDTSRKIWKFETSVAGSFQRLSGKLPGGIVTQLLNFGIFIGNHIGRSESKL